MDHGVCGSSHLEDEDRQEDLGIHSLVCFRSICEDKNSWYAQVHNTHKFYVLDLVFMNSRSKQV